MTTTQRTNGDLVSSTMSNSSTSTTNSQQSINIKRKFCYFFTAKTWFCINLAALLLFISMRMAHLMIKCDRGWPVVLYCDGLQTLVILFVGFIGALKSNSRLITVYLISQVAFFVVYVFLLIYLIFNKFPELIANNTKQESMSSSVTDSSSSSSSSSSIGLPPTQQSSLPNPQKNNNNNFQSQSLTAAAAAPVEPWIWKGCDTSYVNSSSTDFTSSSDISFFQQFSIVQILLAAVNLIFCISSTIYGGAVLRIVSNDEATRYKRQNEYRNINTQPLITE